MVFGASLGGRKEARLRLAMIAASCRMDLCTRNIQQKKGYWQLLFELARHNLLLRCRVSKLSWAPRPQRCSTARSSSSSGCPTMPSRFRNSSRQLDTHTTSEAAKALHSNPTSRCMRLLSMFMQAAYCQALATTSIGVPSLLDKSEVSHSGFESCI